MATEDLVGNYDNKINHLKGLLMKIKDNNLKVYNSELLKDAYKLANFNESVSIKGYDKDRLDAINDKIFNLEKILSEELKMTGEDLKYIKLGSDNYDDEFNENVKKINYINKEIMTKDKLIFMNEDAVKKKDKVLYVLYSIILYIVFMFIPFIFYGLNIISFGLLIGVVILFGLITGIVVTVKYYQMDDINLVSESKKTLNEFALAGLENIVRDEVVVSECPKRCKKRKVSQEEGVESGANEVWLDNSNNIWEEGEIPEIGSNYLGYQKLGKEVEPKQYYGGSSDNVKYICRWKDDPTKMTNMNRGLEFKSVIPCEFYPGYETVRKIK